MNKIPLEIKQKALELYAQNFTQAQIIRQLGLKPTTVNDICKTSPFYKRLCKGGRKKKIIRKKTINTINTTKTPQKLHYIQLVTALIFISILSYLVYSK